MIHIIKESNLPTENPTLRLDIKPVNLDSTANLLGQINGSVGAISPTPTIKTSSFKFVKEDLENVSLQQFDADLIIGF